ncbi:MAG: hypothetical protein OHK93_006257 [Ramalina farinacea]|uniref:Uncharacterized protein n=1 Tax=Ramalina farinacea TaxID=258253 RepID=A0AA43QMI1_9LECA|nr:hypothetical protein [Ramalina farinacea]
MSTPPRTRETHSPASRIAQPGPDRQPNNDALAANLATSLSQGTPSRACANSAKKRRHAPNLSRMHPSPSREERVSTLFQSIAPTLTLSNTRKVRRPLAETRHTRFGEYDADHVREPYSYRSPPKGDHSSEAADPEASREPSGKGVESREKPRPLRRLLSPSAWHAADSTNVDASLEPALRELSTATDREHASEPDEFYKENVKAWLHGTQHLPSDHEAASTGSSSSASSATKTSTPSPITYPKLSTAQFPTNPAPKDSGGSSSSDKENVPPNASTSPPSPSPRPPQLTKLPPSTTPSRFRNPSASASAKPILHLSAAKRTGLPLPPQSSPPKGYFSTPPRRRHRANAIVGERITPSTPSSRFSFRIFEDEAAGGRTVDATAPTTPHSPPTFTAPDWNPVMATAGASDHPAGPGDFTIAREGGMMMDGLAGLSPSVEIKRRGRKREGDGTGVKATKGRCASYWDRDVLDVPGEGGGGKGGKGDEGEGT